MADKPQVEITGLEAKYYDFFLNLISFGQYKAFIRKVIRDLQVTPGEIVMDLGAGTGSNDELMLQYMDAEGKIYALEIGDEMRKQLAEKQIKDSRITILGQRIEERFRLPEPATLAFISFVIHGLKQQDRLKVIENVHENLVDGGRFCILDYNHFNVNEAPWYVKFGVRKLECKPTENFIQQDWRHILAEKGFTDFSAVTYFKNYLRLMCCKKYQVNT